MSLEQKIEKAYLQGVEAVKALFKHEEQSLSSQTPYIEAQLQSLQKQIHALKNIHHYFADVYGELQSPQAYIQDAVLAKVKNILMVQDASIQELETLAQTLKEKYQTQAQTLMELDARLRLLEGKMVSSSAKKAQDLQAAVLAQTSRTGVSARADLNLENYLAQPLSEIEFLKPIRLMVYLDEQLAMADGQIRERFLKNSKAELYHYLAFPTLKSPDIYEVVPKLENYTRRQLALLGMAQIFEITPTLLQDNRPLKTLLKPAIMRYEAGDWLLIHKGKLGF